MTRLEGMFLLTPLWLECMVLLTPLWLECMVLLTLECKWTQPHNVNVDIVIIQFLGSGYSITYFSPCNPAIMYHVHKLVCCVLVLIKASVHCVHVYERDAMQVFAME